MSGKLDDVEVLAYIVVLVVPAVGWVWVLIDRAALRGEMTGLRIQVDDARQKAAEAYGEGYQKGVETSSGILKDTMVTTVGDVTRLMMGEMVGSKDEEVPARAAADQTFEPSWVEWEDVRAVEDFGIGDSVYVPRDYDDRVAAIGDGESIIPGVPLPDMTGESFNE